jgi:hypothetical protein
MRVIISISFSAAKVMAIYLLNRPTSPYRRGDGAAKQD